MKRVKNGCAVGLSVVALCAGGALAGPVAPAPLVETAGTFVTQQQDLMGVQAAVNLAGALGLNGAPTQRADAAQPLFGDLQATEKSWGWDSSGTTGPLSGLGSGAAPRDGAGDPAVMRTEIIPLPGAAGMALAGMGMIGLRRRR